MPDSVSSERPGPDFFPAPALIFQHPRDVLADPDLTDDERRVILASWASDARAVEDAPWIRRLDAGARVTVSEIMEALITLDHDAPSACEEPSGDVRPGDRLAPSP